MYFLRKYGSGVNSTRTDPRDKIFAEYKCDSCGYVADIDITRSPSFDFQEPRKCPSCKSVGSSDRIKNLKTEIEELTKQENKIQIKIDSLCREVDELTHKVCSNEDIH